MSTPVSIVGGVRSRPHTLRGTQFVNLHEDFPKEVNIVFTSQPLNQGGGDLDPLGLARPPRYFGLLMVHLGRPPLPPSRPYHRPLNYPKYVKDYDVHVKVFKVAIQVDNEIDDAKIVNLFIFTLKDTMSDAPRSSLLNPLEGLSMRNCRKLELEGRSRLPTLKGGKRGVLEVPRLD